MASPLPQKEREFQFNDKDFNFISKYVGGYWCLNRRCGSHIPIVEPFTRHHAADINHTAYATTFHRKFCAAAILMLTTEGDDKKKAEGKSAGATGWVVKPFQPDKLVQVVNKVCA